MKTVQFISSKDLELASYNKGLIVYSRTIKVAEFSENGYIENLLKEVFGGK